MTNSNTFNMLDPALPYSVAVGVVNNNITDGVVNPHPSNIITATAVPREFDIIATSLRALR